MAMKNTLSDYNGEEKERQRNVVQWRKKPEIQIEKKVEGFASS